MKPRVLFTLVTLMLLTFVSACKSKKENSAPIEPSLTLTADKKVFVADGKDKVLFTVVDQDGKDVTTSCILNAGGKDLFDNSFVSSASGEFDVFAKNAAGTKSNTIKVKALSEKANFEVRASRTAIVADGGDLINLSLWDKDNDIEITDGAKFYVDGKMIDGHVLRLKEKGNRKVTGMWNNKETKKHLLISGVDLGTITGRSLIETLTATNCQYCKAEITTIETIDEKSDRAIEPCPGPPGSG